MNFTKFGSEKAEVWSLECFTGLRFNVLVQNIINVYTYQITPTHDEQEVDVHFLVKEILAA